MRIFVTGASGFIGSHVTRALMNAGHQVLALALPNDSLWRIQDLIPKVEVAWGMLNDASSYKSQLQSWKPQTCIHLAWYAEPGKYLNSSENLVSLNGSLDLLKILPDCGCEHFIGAGTCAEYEMKPELLLETDKTKPETLYAASKLSFQVLGEQITRQTGLKFAWGRVFYLYGNHEDVRRLIPSVILKLKKGEFFPATPGEQQRDYLHVTDVASAFLSIAENNATGIYNICSARPITIRSMLDTLGNLLGKPELLLHGAIPYRAWEPMFIAGNNQKLTRLGWQPQVQLQEGLKDTIACFKHA